LARQRHRPCDRYAQRGWKVCVSTCSPPR
jgi:hypothetical protein